MNIQFEFLYALFLLLVIPGLYFLYSKYNSEKKDSILKFSSLKIVKKSEYYSIHELPEWMSWVCLSVIKALSRAQLFGQPV